MSKLNEKEVLKYISGKQNVTVKDVYSHFHVCRLTAYVFLKIMTAKGMLIGSKIGPTLVFEVNKEKLMP
jgi:hypothetical protein